MVKLPKRLAPAYEIKRLAFLSQVVFGAGRTVSRETLS
jgi:hypothetical protein